MLLKHGTEKQSCWRGVFESISDDNNISGIDISDIAQQDLVALARLSVFTSQFFPQKNTQNEQKTKPILSTDS